MNCLFSNQECSSGCESGWTLYLEHSSISPYSCNQEDNHIGGRRKGVFTEAKRLKQEEEEEEEDEDLSMVSDASSGPPHLHEEEGYSGNDINGCFYHYPTDDPLSRNGLNRKKNRENRRRKVQDQSSLLDDTASSPFFDFSNKSFTIARSQPSVENALEYSQGYSSTQFEMRPPHQEHYEFFHSSPSGQQLQQNHRWFDGKRW